MAVGIGQAQQTESPGPSILSRGLGTVQQGGGDLLELKPYLSVTGEYDTGLTPVSVTSAGLIPNDTDYGGDLEFGVVGYHSWRHTVLGIDYKGNFRHFARNTYYDGMNQTLTLSLTHQMSRRLSFTLRNAAGVYSRSSGAIAGGQYFDSAYSNVPVNELFDGRTEYLSTMGDLVFQKSARLSFSIGGSGLLIRRRSKALVGVTGWTGRADVAYRVNRRVTIGADYNFTHYEFTNAFGASDIHTAAFNVSTELGRRWNLGLRAGGARVETLGLERVAVDPIIAAIIGVTTGIEAVYRLNYMPAFEAKLSRVFRRSSLSLEGTSGVTPGNGIFLTSRSETASAGYSHTASERGNIGFDAGYTTYSSLAQSIGKYSSYNGGAGFTLRLKKWAHVVGRYDVRRYDVAETAAFRRLQHRVSFGFAFSPGELPLSLW